jgi:choline kinase/phosphohistidine swiveling domain-containing protein
LILGAGEPHSGTTSAPLRPIDRLTSTLDWIISSFASLQPVVHFVSGYAADDMRTAYPHLHFSHNPDWQQTSPAQSLLLGLSSIPGACFITYADIVFREWVVREMCAAGGDLVVAADSNWNDRFPDRGTADLSRCEKVGQADSCSAFFGLAVKPEAATAEFIGLVYLSARARGELARLEESGSVSESIIRDWRLSDIVEILRSRGLDVRIVDVRGDWAELNDPADLSHFVLGTKAQTLDRLRPMVRLGRIEDSLAFTVARWREDEVGCIAGVQSRFRGRKVIMRSSRIGEDGFARSYAGAYKSILDVAADRGRDIGRAVADVIGSFGAANPSDEVLVQPMLDEVLASGVVLTRSLGSMAPYYVLEFDAKSGRTDTVTSGSGQDIETIMVRRDAAPEHPVVPAMLRGVLPAVAELETLLGLDSLDVEFAVTSAAVHVLQVRPMASGSPEGCPDSEVFNAVDQAALRFERLQVSTPAILGRRTIFGSMPDWNPAEIIGTKPRRLSASLYRTLITDQTWADQRAESGYRDVRPFALMKTFVGRPYVDVRASLNSFVPASLPADIAAKIIDFSLDWLEEHPELHDKIEFEVIPTCLALDFDRWERRFGDRDVLDGHDIALWREALAKVTATIVRDIPHHLAQIALLEQRFSRIEEAAMPPLDRAIALLDDCRRYGTLPFAHLARAAFVAVSLLRSAVEKAVISEDESADFMRAIRTVGHEFARDADLCRDGVLSEEAFVARYGHLRPGTYEITSPTYRENRVFFRGPSKGRCGSDNEEPVAPALAGIWAAARNRFFRAFEATGIDIGHDDIERFMIAAIEGRERAKFAFTRNLSVALDSIGEWGRSLGLDLGEVSDLSIDDLRDVQAGDVAPHSIEAIVSCRARQARGYERVSRLVELPPLVVHPSDFTGFLCQVSIPNFIGRRAVAAPCVTLRIDDRSLDLDGVIVLVPQADPGYDWIFSRRVAGLITMYGGVNSHMAIRAAEFSVPAALGVGEQRFRRLCSAEFIELDPVGRTIRTGR